MFAYFPVIDGTAYGWSDEASAMRQFQEAREWCDEAQLVKVNTETYEESVINAYIA